MLVLSRKENEVIRIGDEIEITVLQVSGNRVRIGISAPRDVVVMRGELAPFGIAPTGENSSPIVTSHGSAHDAVAVF